MLVTAYGRFMASEIWLNVGSDRGSGAVSYFKLEYYSSENVLNQISSFCDNFTWTQVHEYGVNFCFLSCQIKLKIKQGKSTFY